MFAVNCGLNARKFTTDHSVMYTIYWRSLVKRHVQANFYNFCSFGAVILNRCGISLAKTYSLINLKYSSFSQSIHFVIPLVSAPEVFISLSDVQNQIKKAIGIIAYLEVHLSQTESVVAERIQKVALMRNMSKDGVTLINDSLANGRKLWKWHL